MNDNWTHVIFAGPPFDAMGAEFAGIFSNWLEDTYRHLFGFDGHVFDLFEKRLALATKHNTWFATQMANDVWRDRYAGKGFDPCYSFAVRGLERTRLFHRWAEDTFAGRLPDSHRIWDTDYAPYPHLPIEAMAPVSNRPMPVFEHVYRPVAAARAGGILKMRTLAYSENTFLFEHVRNNWVPLIREEAKSWWMKAFRGDAFALGAFEWTWVRTNPFGRSAALTADAMSLVVQRMNGWKMRDAFYHQDQEALLMPFDAYCAKRQADLINGFAPMFSMR
jgi:hypothetical protein